MKKTRIYLSAILSLTLILWGCERDNEINRLPPSNLRSIVGFVLNPYSNPGDVSMKFTASIDETNKIIKLKLPKDQRLDSIRPEISIAPWASISPMSLEPVDLTKDTVEYTVTAQSGKKAVYSVVKDMTYLYTNNSIYSISFTNVFDSSTGNPVRQTFWLGGAYQYFSYMIVPSNTDRTKINTNLEMAGDSFNSTISVSEDGTQTATSFRPFTNPVNYTKTVYFKVKSEDGKKENNYKIQLAQ